MALSFKDSMQSLAQVIPSHIITQESMRQRSFSIELLNIDTNTKTHHHFKVEEQACIPYSLILKTILRHNPQTQPQTLAIYYFQAPLWLFLPPRHVFDLQDLIEEQAENNESDQPTLRIKYHQAEGVSGEEQGRLGEDVNSLSEKINHVEELFLDIKDKYIQQALDINLFWGNPLFACDDLERSKKGKQAEVIRDWQGRNCQLLKNQVKYPPYINAVTKALEECDKKVHLELDLLNERSFSQKNIFTVVYLIAHLQIEESRKRHDNESGSASQVYPRSSDEKRRFKKTYVQKKKPEDIEIKVEAPVESAQDSREMSAVSSELKSNASSGPAQMTSSSSLLAPPAEYQRSAVSQTDPRPVLLSKQSIPEQPLADDEFIWVDSERKGRKKAIKPYFLGEEMNSELCKISPKKLESMLRRNLSKKIELLILHTSYPYYHLEALRPFANNILLIDSNPIVPQPSTIFFLKQFFLYFLKTSNIHAAYHRAIQQLNKLKALLLSPATTDHEFDPRDIAFIHSINEKYVHGSLSRCCCYHEHKESCHNRHNYALTRFAEYHYRYHSASCDCHPEHLNVHSCEAKRVNMLKTYRVIGQQYQPREFYYCCCQGKEMEFYLQEKGNIDLLQLESAHEEKDPHSLKFKYRLEKSVGPEDQIELSEGRPMGDVGEQLLQAFAHLEDSYLIGNKVLILNMLQCFTQELQDNALETTRKLLKNQRYMLCNLYGEAHTGKKTIANYMAQLLLTKKLYRSVVIRVIKDFYAIRSIVDKAETEGRPFYIFILEESSNRLERRSERLSEGDIGQPISAILITQERVSLGKKNPLFEVAYHQPNSFRSIDCENFVKKYKHLNFNAKTNIKSLFFLANKDHPKENSQPIYPCSLNEFEILNIVGKTAYGECDKFIEALDRVNPEHIAHYVFIASVAKFTTGPKHRHENTERLSYLLEEIRENNALFLRRFREFEAGREGMTSTREEELRVLKDSLVSLEQINRNYYLILACTGHKFQAKLKRLLQMFINYSSVIPKQALLEEPRLKRRANEIRVKQGPFSPQVYEATSINPDSYLSRYFKQELEEVHFSLTLNREKENPETFDLERFIDEHAQLFEEHLRLSKKLIYESKSKSKERHRRHPHIDHSSSLDSIHQPGSDNRSYLSLSSTSELSAEHHDIPNFHHLSAVIEGGLQFVRYLVCTHFIYNRLSEAERVEVVRLSILLINNCVILLKNHPFFEHASGSAQAESASHVPHPDQHSYESFFVNPVLESPDFMSRRSETFDLPPTQATRTYSGGEIINSTRQLPHLEPSSPSRKNFSSQRVSRDEDKKDELLMHQLHRLSTHKGLLFLLAELERRSETLAGPGVVQARIAVQLLSIQIRLEQLQLDPRESRVEVPSHDRHMSRIAHIFNERNYNLNELYRILTQEVQRRLDDMEQIALIKAHFIVAMALMTSRYGKHKIVQARSMTHDIERFLEMWNEGVPLLRRESQQPSLGSSKEDFTNRTDLPPQFAFMRAICDNQSVYLQLMDSFSAGRFWRATDQPNQELELYQALLDLFHNFTLKNTNNSLDYANKLEQVRHKLCEFRHREVFQRASTYVHNFHKDFLKMLEKEFRGLRQSIVLTLAAEDGKHYAKLSLHQQLKEGLRHSKYLVMRKKFSLESIAQVVEQQGCKYLCVYTASPSSNSKDLIQTETQEGKITTANKEQLVQELVKIPCNVLFLCLPKRNQLAELVVASSHSRIVVSFDFHHDCFTLLCKDEKTHDRVLSFQRMIMVETVSQILKGMVELERKGSYQCFSQSYANAIHNLSFTLESGKGEPLIRLENEDFRQCLWVEGLSKEELSFPPDHHPSHITFSEKQMVSGKQIDTLQKIAPHSSSGLMRASHHSAERVEEFKLSQFRSVRDCIESMWYYYRHKHNYEHIFKAHLDPRDRHPVRRFLEQLTGEGILDFIFSRKRGMLVLHMEPEQHDAKVFQECEGELAEVLRVFDEEGEREIHRAIGIGNNRKQKVVSVYFFSNRRQ